MSNDFVGLWMQICKTLDSGLPNWRTRIMQAGQVSAVEAREKGHCFSDNEIFEGIVKAILSNSTDWSKMERILPELYDLFHDFDLNYYSTLKDHQINDIFIPWFLKRSAGSMTMKRSLIDLITTARKLFEFSQRTGSLEKYFSFLLKMTGNDAMNLVCAIGSPNSKHKLPALGIPIAAEAMKNIGFDVAKPDRHVNRAVGCFKLIRFSSWSDRSATKPPIPKENELIEVMKVVASFASSVGVRVSFLDNAIWLLCAKSGLYFSNASLSKLQQNCFVK